MGQHPDPRVEIGHVRLHVANLERSIAFYSGVLGFEVTRRDAERVTLGTSGRPGLIVLSPRAHAAEDGAQPLVAHHFSIRYPDGPSFADVRQRLTSAHISEDAAEDDGNEAVTVRDPDGNEVELYWARSAQPQPRHDEQAAGDPQQPALGETGRQRLGELRTRMLDLHKVLLDDTRSTYELDRGRVGSNANLLQLVINDPWFAWLRAISELVVRIDQIVEDPQASSSDAAAIVAEVEQLLTASETGEGFARRYFDALQRQPSVVLAHADVRRTIKSMR